MKEEDRERLERFYKYLEDTPAESKEWDQPVDIPMYHGTRQHGTPEEIIERGLESFPSAEEGVREIEEALEYFGKSDIVDKPQRGGIVRSLMHEVSSPHRRKIYATSFEEATGSWAMRNPEIISLALRHSGVPDDAIRRYLERKYGRRTKVRLSYKPQLRDAYGGVGITNISTGMERVPREFIESVEQFPEDDFLDKYRGSGWVRLSKLPDEELELLNNMLSVYTEQEWRFLGLRLLRRGGRVTNFKVA